MPPGMVVGSRIIAESLIESRLVENGIIGNFEANLPKM
jgi:hypothetical protein